MQGKAIFSACGTWRYRLEREIGAGSGVIAMIMVNPARADHERNDPTIRSCIRLAGAWDCRRLVVGNLFAFCASDIRALRSAADPVGPGNEGHLDVILREADLLVVAWGHLGKLPPPLRQRWRDLVEMARGLGRPLHCLGLTKDGQPRHPLFMPGATPLTLWQPPP
jgi:hypothetical protein